MPLIRYVETEVSSQSAIDIFLREFGAREEKRDGTALSRDEQIAFFEIFAKDYTQGPENVLFAVNKEGPTLMSTLLIRNLIKERVRRGTAGELVQPAPRRGIDMQWKRN